MEQISQAVEDYDYTKKSNYSHQCEPDPDFAWNISSPKRKLLLAGLQTSSLQNYA